MDYRKVMAGASVCALLALGTGSARAQENVAIEPGSSEPAPLVEEGWELPGISVFADFASRRLSRGLPDNTDPVSTYGVAAEWYGLTFEVDWLIDLTDERGTKGEYDEIDYIIGYGYTFDADAWNLPTSIEVAADWTYEYHPDDAFTHYIHASVGLPDLWLAPALSSEFEMRSECRYFALSVGHTWTLIDARPDEDTPVLDFSISIEQGLANDRQNNADLGKDFWALRETTFLAQLDWCPQKNLMISPYIAYGDTYSGTIRSAAHYYTDPEEDHSPSQFFGGITLTLSL